MWAISHRYDRMKSEVTLVTCSSSAYIIRRVVEVIQQTLPRCATRPLGQARRIVPMAPSAGDRFFTNPRSSVVLYRLTWDCFPNKTERTISWTSSALFPPSVSAVCPGSSGYSTPSDLYPPVEYIVLETEKTVGSHAADSENVRYWRKPCCMMKYTDWI